MPDEREVWQASRADDPHIYVWSMRDPMAPVLAERISMKSRHGAHWLTFDIEGNYAYVAPDKSSDDATEIVDAHTHKSVGLFGSSEDIVRDRFCRWQGQPRRQSVWRWARRAHFDELIDAAYRPAISVATRSYRDMKPEEK